MSKRRQYYQERGVYAEKIPFRRLRLFLAAVFAGMLLIGLIGGVYATIVVSKADKIDPVMQLGKMKQEKNYVPLDKIAPFMKKAVVAIEDKRFYKHKGIDYWRIAGAAVYDIRHLSLEQGGSTLTMQLAKMWYTSSKKSFERKILDAWYAREIEKVLSKEDILEAYLNTAGFSQGTVGIEEAAQRFFRVKAQKLDLAQSALLAGVVNRPVKYTPGILAEVTLEDRPEFLQLKLEPSKGRKVSQDEKKIYLKLLNTRKISHLEYERLLVGKAAAKKVIVNPNAKARQEYILQIMLDQRDINERQYGIAVNENLVIHMKNPD